MPAGAEQRELGVREPRAQRGERGGGHEVVTERVAAQHGDAPNVKPVHLRELPVSRGGTHGRWSRSPCRPRSRRRWCCARCSGTCSSRCPRCARCAGTPRSTDRAGHPGRARAAGRRDRRGRRGAAHPGARAAGWPGAAAGRRGQPARHRAAEPPGPGRGPRRGSGSAAAPPAGTGRSGRRDRVRGHPHERERWCAMLAAYGIPADPADLRLPPPPPRPGRRAPPVVHPGARYGAKRWPPAGSPRWPPH